MVRFICVAIFVIFSSVQGLAAKQRSLSKSYGPPVFFLQDPSDGLCLAGSRYKRCGLDTLWYVSGKPGTYQIHHRIFEDDELGHDDGIAENMELNHCLDKKDCHLDDSLLIVGDCGHCGAKKWNILGDAKTGYVLTEDKNRYCVQRIPSLSGNHSATNNSKSNSNRNNEDASSPAASPDEVRIGKCDKGYSTFSLQFVNQDELKVMRSDNAKFIKAILANDNPSITRFLDVKKVDVNLRDWDNMTAVIAASGQGNYDLVVKLVSKYNANIHLVDKDYITALMEACRSGNVQLVEFLLKHGAKVEETASSGVTALWLAAGEGHLEIVKLLLNHGGDANNARSDGITALMVASAGGHVDVVEELLRAGAIADAKDSVGLTALINAAENGTVPLVKLLLEHGASVHVLSDTGFTPLIIASAQGHLEVVKILADAGASVNGLVKVANTQGETVSHQAHPDGVTPLMYAAAGNHTELVKFLIAQGAEVNARHKQGGNALTEATTAGGLDCVQVLLDAGADALVVDNDGVTTLMSAASQGHTAVCTLLLEKGVDVNAIANSGGTALMYAVGSGHIETVRLLVSHGADVNIAVLASPEYIEEIAKAVAEGKEDVEEHRDGVTALMLAAQGGHEELVKILLEADADVNAQDDEEATALHYAMKGNFLEIAKILVVGGANPNDLYKDEKTSKVHHLLMDSILANNEDFAALLVNHGANTSYVDEDGVTPLIQAAYQGMTEIVKALLSQETASVDVSAMNNEGINALIAASSEGHIEVIKLLLANPNCDVNSKDKDGTNAMMAAAVRGHKDVIAILVAHGADINAQNIDGHTALMFAYNGKNQVETLLDKYAEYFKNSEVDEILISNDGGSDDLSSAALIRQTLQQHIDVVKFLISSGADVNVKDNEGHIASDFDYQPPESEVTSNSANHEVRQEL